MNQIIKENAGKRIKKILIFFSIKNLGYSFVFSSKNEFVRSFFGRIRGYQKSFRNYLTFKYVESKLAVCIVCGRIAVMT